MFIVIELNNNTCLMALCPGLPG